MSDGDANEAMREAAREVLRELLPSLLREAGVNGGHATNGSNGHATVGNGSNGHATVGNGSNGHATVGNGHASKGNGNGNGHAPVRVEPTQSDPGVVPVVPAPPVAAVLRPSTWAGPAAPGEVIGDFGQPAPRPDDPTAPRAPATASSLPAGASSLPAGASSLPAGASSLPAGASSLPADPNAEPVTIDSDEDLDRFVRALAARLDNPRDRRLIRTGKLRFTLRRTPAPGPRRSGADAPVSPAMRVEKGAVTERTVKQASAAGARLVLARAAVITPLARDQARALGVQIEREGKC